jgi:hypothetical protein
MEIVSLHKTTYIGRIFMKTPVLTVGAQRRYTNFRLYQLHGCNCSLAFSTHKLSVK